MVHTEPLWQTLVKTIAGVSPLLAREIAGHTQGDLNGLSEPTQAAKIIETLERLTHAPWQPTVAFEDGEPAAFAPYWLTQFNDVRAFDSISAAIEAFYGTAETYAAIKESMRTPIVDARDRLTRKRDALVQEQMRAGDIERLRVSGEMILAYAHTIEPRQAILRAETENGIIEIPLDSNLSAVENAQKYFKEYHRAKDAAARVPALLEQANAEIEYAEQMLNDLELAENRAEIDAVVAAAREAGLIAEAKQKNHVKPSEPRAFTSRDGFTILVGKNARQNEDLTFHRARADDVWLHARNVAGAHVVIVKAGRDIPATTIEEAATLAAQYSQARHATAVDVIVTERKNVHRVRGGKPGLVTTTNAKIVRVVL
jgi:predicted ribosome quality control (RQC) complex YloA/Tae2 family protein